MPAIEIIHERPKIRLGYPPLLFIHGAFQGAWCWMEHVVPYFVERGFECVVISLRGHGRSRLVDLQKVTFRDYVADLVQVAALLPDPAFLVGHSMGAVVAQGYAQYHTIAGLSLLTPMCAIKTPHRLQATLHFAKHHLAAWAEMLWLKHPHALVKTVDRCRKTLFGPTMPKDNVQAYFEKMQDESIPVLMQISSRNVFRQPLRTGFPCQIIEAERDTLVYPGDLDTLAQVYQVKKELVRGSAHSLMLDENWRIVCEKILLFITQQIPRKTS